MKKQLRQYKYNKIVRAWLILGLIMLIGQVFLGGITRLTGSGLSITKWDIITGIIPPLSTQQWNEAFELYKQTPQFHKINSAFTLKDFKSIYFWEYTHRLWVRLLGIIFLIPFITFIIKKKIDWYLIKRLLIVVVLAALTASAGWIMVLSGLMDRPWVNAYKLTLHFILAILTIGMLVKTIADVYYFENKSNADRSRFTLFLLIITFIQLILAGLMSGMRAALYYPTWPSMNGKTIPDVLLTGTNWTLHNLTNYDSFSFAPALIQFSHRLLAYVILGLTMFYYFKMRNNTYTRAIKWLTYTYSFVIFQIFLGILTLIKSKTGIPVTYAILHQLTGVLFFVSLLFLHLSLKRNKVY